MTKKHFVWIALAALLAAPALAGDMTVDEIIAKNIESRGGMDALKAVDSALVTAKMNMGGGMEAPVTMTFKRPNKLRFEMEMQGMKIVQAFDGERGWGVMPMMGQTEPDYLADDQLKQVKSQSDFDGPLVDYKEKGHTVELLGKEDVEGTEAYTLKLTQANGDVITMYLDTEYYLIFKQEQKVSMQGMEANSTSNIGDYKEVGGIVMAHSWEQVMEGAPAGMTMTIESVELDAEVDDSVFVMPEKPEKEADEGEEKEG